MLPSLQRSLRCVCSWSKLQLEGREHEHAQAMYSTNAATLSPATATLNAATAVRHACLHLSSLTTAQRLSSRLDICRHSNKVAILSSDDDEDGEHNLYQGTIHHQIDCVSCEYSLCQQSRLCALRGASVASSDNTSFPASKQSMKVANRILKARRLSEKADVAATSHVSVGQASGSRFSRQRTTLKLQAVKSALGRVVL